MLAEPDNAAIAIRMARVVAMRDRGEATVPTTIAAEHATNPFLRVGSVAELAALRAARDDFR
jgi:hydroxyacylglutathione hydrolase